MVLPSGLYEQLINRLISNKLELLPKETYYISKTKLDIHEASRYLSAYLIEIIGFALNEIKEGDRPAKQIELANKIIQLLISELKNLDFEGNLIANEGKLLQAVFSKIDFPFTDFESHINSIMPYTRLSQSELFTGNNVGLQMDSEIRKEILSSDEIWWMVSFIKMSGINIFKEELREFSKAGKKIKIITTSYMGASDLKAIDFLASLPNSELKVSYNSNNERLHAKAYLFLRNTGFHTGYIGSSNISKSALTKGVEWNMKVTSREISHIIDKFKKTFETFWEDKNYAPYSPNIDREKLKKALKIQRNNALNQQIAFFEIKPFPYQEEILQKLLSERAVHSRYKNLIVAATGTGKTVLSAFDFKQFSQSRSNVKLLYVAHRKEILLQARQTFQQIIRNVNFGELWVDGIEPESYETVFASVQTLNNHIGNLSLSEYFYDYIIIDEVHHISANSYRPIIEYFKPKILLGLTATPERMDGANILSDFSNVIAAEIRLPEALNRKLLCPFQYFAISDSVDISNVSWRNGKYEINELTKLYTENDRRVGDILRNCFEYLADISNTRALGFCVSQQHAIYMAQKFTIAGINADYLTSENSNQREILREKLLKKDINFLFVVDIFNEGVDLPEIDTLLFLRPTESLTVFIQQLGRGLRLAEDKEYLTVLDFVGNSRDEYDFEQKFRALIGKTHTSILKEIRDDFPHLPLGCSIVLEKKAKEVIINNIRTVLDFRKSKLLQKIQNFKHQSTLQLNLKNFSEFYGISLTQIYKRGSWKKLCSEAGEIKKFEEPNEKDIIRFISKKLLNYNSMSYLLFIKSLLNDNQELNKLSPEEELMSIMLHYDIWQKPGPKLGFTTIEESILALKRNPVLISEILELIELLINKIDFIEKKIDLGYPFPICVYSRYSRDQILTAMRLHTLKKASSNREGVAFQQKLNTEALFVTLKKSEKDYSPTTMYDDYALNEILFHWQSQNSASPVSSKGKSYIHHHKLGKKIILFVREKSTDENGLTIPFVFLGEASFIKSEGAKPMNIEWKLKEPIPSYLLKESQKLAVG